MLVWLALPLLVVRWDQLPEKQLADFTGFSTALEQHVSVLDIEGKVHEGRLVAATGDGVTMRMGGSDVAIPRSSIISGERTHDDPWDGMFKGALVGILGVLSASGEVRTTGVDKLRTTAIMAGVGYLLDRAAANPQPLYRAPAAPAPQIKISLRF